MITNFDFISGKDIRVGGYCYVKQIKLSDIKNNGYDEYIRYLSIIALNKNNIMHFIKADADVKKVIEQLNYYDIMLMNSQTGESLAEALNYFVREKIEYSAKHKTIVITGADAINKLSSDMFLEIRWVILKSNGVETDEKPISKFASNTAKAISEKISKGRSKMESAKTKQNSLKKDRNELWNIVGAVSAYSKTYNLINIWDLTVYQLYDQFTRIDNNFYLDMSSMRWCIWGEDAFDADPWYDTPYKKQ